MDSSGRRLLRGGPRSSKKKMLALGLDPYSSSNAYAENLGLYSPKRIHGRKETRGIVRVEWHGWMKRTDGDIVACGTENSRRQKVCLECKDKGRGLFMGIVNSRNTLIAIWDLLEGDTFLPL